MLVLALDFETSGLDYTQHAPLTFAAALCHGAPDLPVLATYETGVMRVHEGAFVSDQALKVNGISRAEIATGRDPNEAAREFIAWLDEHRAGEPVTLAAHFIAFDLDFLRDWLTRAKIPGGMSRFNRRTFDTMPLVLAHLVLGGKIESASLQAATTYLGIPHAAHTAMGDVEALLAVTRRLLAGVPECLPR